MASSMLASCCILIPGPVRSSLLLLQVLMGEPLGLVTVLFQFARPAVERNVLDQIIFTPPVEAERVESLEDVIFLSSSCKRSSAIFSFVESNAAFAAFWAFFSARRRCRSAFSGDFKSEVGFDFVGDEQGLGGDEDEVFSRSC